jgi:hypothetical protein
MIHLGDITKIHGDQIEPVDVWFALSGFVHGRLESWP